MLGYDGKAKYCDRNTFLDGTGSNSRNWIRLRCGHLVRTSFLKRAILDTLIRFKALLIWPLLPHRSLGITALEMAEGKAPYGEIHPMRAIFMIPTKPPPSFSDPDKWSSQLIDFVSRCALLVFNHRFYSFFTSSHKAQQSPECFNTSSF